jgi:hypothetical protein
MRVVSWIFLLACIVFIVGCSRARPAVVKVEPLTVQEWAALPPPEKYNVDTLERVKAGDPRFQDEQQWDQFTRHVMIPAKQRDLAQGKFSQ